MANISDVEYLKKLMTQRGASSVSGTILGSAGGFVDVQVAGSPHIVKAVIPANIPLSSVIVGRRCAIGVNAETNYLIAVLPETADDSSGYVPIAIPRLSAPGISVIATGHREWAVTLSNVNGANQYFIYASNNPNGQNAIDMQPVNQFTSNQREVVLYGVPTGVRYFAARAVDAYGHEGPLSAWVTDADAPPTPTGLSVMIVPGDQAALAVDASDESADHRGYRHWEVWWCRDPQTDGDGWFLTTWVGSPFKTSVVMLPNPTRSSPPVQDNVYYRIRAVDWAGNVSGWSAWVKDIDAVVVLTLNVYKVQNGYKLIWNPDSRIKKVIIEGATSNTGANAVTILEAGPSVSTHTDLTGKSWYRIKSWTLDGNNSGWSGWKSDTTPPITPGAPHVESYFSNVGDGAECVAKISYPNTEPSAQDPGFKHWEVYYSTSSSGNGTFLGTLAKGGVYTDRMAPGEIRYYYARAVDYGNLKSNFSLRSRIEPSNNAYGQIDEKWEYLSKRYWSPVLRSCGKSGNTLIGWEGLGNSFVGELYAGKQPPYRRGILIQSANTVGYPSAAAQFIYGTPVNFYASMANGLSQGDVFILCFGLYNSASTTDSYTVTVRFYTNDSNYFEYSFDTTVQAGGINYKDVLISNFTKIGSPAWSNITKVRFTATIKTYSTTSRWVDFYIYHAYFVKRFDSNSQNLLPDTGLGGNYPSRKLALGSMNPTGGYWVHNSGAIIPFSRQFEELGKTGNGVVLVGTTTGTFFSSATFFAKSSSAKVGFVTDSVGSVLGTSLEIGQECGIAFGLRFDYSPFQPNSGFMVRLIGKNAYGGTFTDIELVRIGWSNGKTTLTPIKSVLDDSGYALSTNAYQIWVDWKDQEIKVFVVYGTVPWGSSSGEIVFAGNVFAGDVGTYPVTMSYTDTTTSRGAGLALWAKKGNVKVLQVFAGSPAHAQSSDYAMVAQSAYSLKSPVQDDIEFAGNVTISGSLIANTIAGAITGDTWRGSGADMAIELSANAPRTLAIRNNLARTATLAVDGDVIAASFNGIDLSAHVNNITIHHAPISLSAQADTLFGLSGQQITLDSQEARKFFAGPTSGSAVPTFRNIVAQDLPAHSHISAEQGGAYPWANISGFGTSTNSISLTASAGVSTLVSRADHVHALSQSIIPTWTGKHTWNVTAIDALKVTGDGLALVVDSQNKRLGVGIQPDVSVDVVGNMRFRSGNSKVDFSITSGGELQIAPSGNRVTLDISDGALTPRYSHTTDLGTLTSKFRALHVAELWAETLVAQQTLATIGGRVLVGPTTVLDQPVSASDTEIYVKHNNLQPGDIIYFEVGGRIEFMQVTSSGTAMMTSNFGQATSSGYLGMF